MAVANSKSMSISYGVEAKYKFPTAGVGIEFDPSTKCQFIDVIQYTASSDTRTNINEGFLDDASLNSWLDEDFPQSLHRSEESDDVESKLKMVGGLRLLLGHCGSQASKTEDRRTMPFRKDCYEKLERFLGIPSDFQHALIGTIGRAFKFSCPPNSGGPYFSPSTCFVFRFGVQGPNFYQIAASYDPARNLTYAIILTKSQTHQYQSLLQMIKQNTIHIAHPLCVVSLVVELVHQTATLQIHIVHDNLNRLEEATGQHEYINVALRDPLKTDFMAATRRLNFASRVIVVERTRAGSMIASLEMMLNEGKTIVASQDQRVSETYVRELIGSHLNVYRNLTLRAEMEDVRAARQLAVVYQFMAIKEAITNGQVAKTSAIIAKESKKDSSAMKAIAVLTMFFLPGTFLATIFAMPVFNWEDSNSPAIREGFKYYWAIAIPITFLVLVIWGLSVWLPWAEWLSTFRPKKHEILDEFYGQKNDTFELLNITAPERAADAIADGGPSDIHHNASEPNLSIPGPSNQVLKHNGVRTFVKHKGARLLSYLGRENESSSDDLVVYDRLERLGYSLELETFEVLRSIIQILTVENDKMEDDVPETNLGKGKLAVRDMQDRSTCQDDPTLFRLVDNMDQLLTSVKHRVAFEENDETMLEQLIYCLRRSWSRGHLPLDMAFMNPGTLPAPALDPEYFLTPPIGSSRYNQWPQLPWHKPLCKFHSIAREDEMGLMQFIHWLVVFRNTHTMSLFSEPMLQFHVWDRLCTVIEHLDYHVDNVQADETRGEMTQVAYTLRADILWQTARYLAWYQGSHHRECLPPELTNASREDFKEMVIDNITSAYQVNSGAKMSQVITTKLFAELCEQIVETHIQPPPKSTSYVKQLRMRHPTAEEFRDKWRKHWEVRLLEWHKFNTLKHYPKGRVANRGSVPTEQSPRTAGRPGSASAPSTAKHCSDPMIRRGYIPIQHQPFPSHYTNQYTVSNHVLQRTAGLPVAQNYPGTSSSSAQDYSGTSFPATQNHSRASFSSIQNYPGTSLLSTQNYPGASFTGTQNYAAGPDLLIEQTAKSYGDSLPNAPSKQFRCQSILDEWDEIDPCALERPRLPSQKSAPGFGTPQAVPGWERQLQVQPPPRSILPPPPTMSPLTLPPPILRPPSSLHPPTEINPRRLGRDVPAFASALPSQLNPAASSFIPSMPGPSRVPERFRQELSPGERNSKVAAWISRGPSYSSDANERGPFSPRESGAESSGNTSQASADGNVGGKNRRKKKNGNRKDKGKGVERM
ncbi:hypothetical protein GLAREA_04290 [Glarea lozoyensis ATCC 20868]|uniref:Uncharacterized protein n=1 Tax=Glarea lozoyensis (strain ATCC 20868 / MF5171) TaxID=1116229 RepID=S3CQV0_GLAL2|nr:uncharacterized protein GLAREA_04290 [Glarea lozoyensis ATCC 20868]EPE27499.1 hypothetical protein GLAREA_04290 [Glarea lozoyensis ATCC 20868]